MPSFENSAKAIIKPNRFSTKDWTIQEFSLNELVTIEDVVTELKLQQLEDMVVIVNGRVIENFEQRLQRNDQIIITPKIEEPLTAISLIAGGLGLAGLALEVTALTIAGAVLSFGVAIYSALNRPKLKNRGNQDESSPTYSWQGIQTLQEQGIVLPILYGTHRVGGNIINQFVGLDNNDSYLNILLGLCCGEIDSVRDIKINGNSIDNYTDVEFDIRQGTNDQTSISGFESIHVNTPFGNVLDLSQKWTTQTIDEIDSFTVSLVFESGAHYYQGQSTHDIHATYTLRYKLASATDWEEEERTLTLFSTQSISRSHTVSVPTRGVYDVEIAYNDELTYGDRKEKLTLEETQNIDAKHTLNYKMSITNLRESIDEDLSYPNLALLGLKIKGTDQLSGTAPNITAVVNGKKIYAPRVTDENGLLVPWDAYYWDPVDEVYKDLEDDEEYYFDGTFDYQYSGNPIFCLRDLLLNKTYGLGDFLKEEDLDLSMYLELSRYCEEKMSDLKGGFEKRFVLNCVLDSPSTAPDILTQLSAVFRGLIFYAQGRIVLRIDKEDTPVQMFSMGNIIEGSFSQNWKSLREKYNQIDVSFLDEDKNYEQEVISVIDEESLSNGDPLRKQEVRVFCTKASQALRLGHVALAQAKFLNQTVSFKASIEAVSCSVGDVISLSHDVPSTGISGRVKDWTSPYLTIDQDFNYDSAKSYTVYVRTETDTLFSSEVVLKSGTSDIVEVQDLVSFSASVSDPYTIVETTINIKPYRIISITRSSNNEVEISAIEYNETVYDESGLALPTSNYSTLNVEIPMVTDLASDERLVLNKDGSISSVVDVSFSKPILTANSLNPYISAKVFFQVKDTEDWIFAGETYGQRLTVQHDFKEFAIYTFAVVTVSTIVQMSIENAPKSECEILGKTAPPSDVKNFNVSYSPVQLNFKWEPVTDIDLKSYEIRELSSPSYSWETGVAILTNLKDTSASFYDLTARTYFFGIKALDTSGNYSENITTSQITVTKIYEQNIFKDFDEDIFLDLSYAQTESVYVEDCFRNVFKKKQVVKTENTWDSGEYDSGLTYDIPTRTPSLEETWDLRDSGFVTKEDTLRTSIKWDSDNTYDTSLTFDDPIEVNEDLLWVTDIIDIGEVRKAKILTRLEVATEFSGHFDIFISTGETEESMAEYVLFAPGEYTLQFARFKLVPRNADDSFFGAKFKIAFDLPDKEQTKLDEYYDGINATIVTLDQVYEEVKTLVVTSSTTNLTAVVDKSDLPNSFSVELVNASDVKTQGEFGYFLKGY
ncbi:hypothetical protein AB834_00825 [PVC group bacterium (ex Bugula neritina AB1)]|nr:hypothetical protein AB834_00825 [PVC group bacterium (ex Bugula neritina AB1)]